MSVFEQLNLIKENVANVYDSEILIAMNKKYRELEEEIKLIKTMQVVICKN